MDNGYHEIYVNAEVHDSTDIAEYMEIFSSSDVHANTKFSNICDVVRYYRKGKGRGAMCTVVEEYVKECVKEKAVETAKLLLSKDIAEDIIQEATGLSLEELSELKMNL